MVVRKAQPMADTGQMSAELGKVRAAVCVSHTKCVNSIWDKPGKV